MNTIHLIEEQLIYGTENPMIMSKGAVYVATGEQFVKEAELAVKSLSDKMPDLSTTIVTDQGTDPSGFDNVLRLAEPSYSFKDKILGLQMSPYEKCVFLDTDTYVSKPFPELFELLNQFDIAVTHNQNRDIHTSNLGVPKSFPEYSTGVIAFNKSETSNLFENWLKSYEDRHNGDQPAFRKCLYEDDIRVTTLPREYNYSVRIPAHLVKTVIIFHGRLLDINSPGAPLYYNIPDSVSRINSEKGHRLLTTGGYFRSTDPPITHRICDSINNRGIVGSISRVFEKYTPPYN